VLYVPTSTGFARIRISRMGQALEFVELEVGQAKVGRGHTKSARTQAALLQQGRSPDRDRHRSPPREGATGIDTSMMFSWKKRPFRVLGTETRWPLFPGRIAKLLAKL